MIEREVVKQAYLTGERPLFHAEHMDVYDTIFTDGESPQIGRASCRERV